MRRGPVRAVTVALAMLGFAPPLNAIDRPNIVFLLADDLGYTDIAPYGSEVNTPALSKLAEEGVRFTNYHTAANCAPARAMLLTGVNNHLAGVPNIPEMLAPEQMAHENYQGVLGDNVVTIATLLESSGYHTYMAGKWHLGAAPGKLPSQRGFERTVALMDSGADNWEQRPYLPIYDRANWFADGQRFELPDDFYSSRFLIDKTIEFIGSNLGNGKPFFAYVPFQAVHIPVQAPQAYIDRYMGAYDEGWDHLRQARHDRAVALGVLPKAVPTARMSTTADWGALSPERQRYEAKRMAVYAGMIEAMDANIGRLLTYLERQGQLENTIFIFTSDNGAEGSGAQDPTSFSANSLASSLGYSTDYGTLGLKGSYNAINPGFTSAAVSPLSFYKFYVGEGGLRVPLIVSGRPLQASRAQTDAFAWATDVAATILAFAGVDKPDGRFAGKPVLPITGKDLGPVVRGEVERVYQESEAVGYELTGHAVLFQGEFKIVRNLPPLGDGEWRLFNIVRDPGEVRDLKAEMPDLFQEMLDAYARFEQEHKVMPIPPGYSQTRQIVINMLRDQYGSAILVALLTILLLVPFVVYVRTRDAVRRR
ncbi:MAG: arylsulfatase [Gammaproteobacteria bacterium]|nr:arylsulfatase [Gammaproteobacteria bacterium]